MNAPSNNDLGLMIVSCEMLIAKLFEIISGTPEIRQAVQKYLENGIQDRIQKGFAPATYQPLEMVLDLLKIAYSDGKPALTLVPSKPEGNS